MKFKEVLKRANRNTWNRKLRSILTILSVTVGATTLTLAVALGSGTERLVQSSINSQELKGAVWLNKIPQEVVEEIEREQAERQSEEERGGVPEYNPTGETGQPQEEQDPGTAVITQEDRAQVEAITGVDRVYPIYHVPALYITLDGKNYLANIDSAEPSSEYKPLQGEELASLSQTGIMLSKTYAISLGVPEQDLLGKTASVTFINRQTGRTTARALPVVGVMADVFGGYPSHVNYDTMASVATELDMLDTGRAVVTLDEGYRDDQNLLNVSEFIEGASPQFRVSSPVEDKGEARTVIRIFRIGLISFAAIVLLAALFGISNTLLTSVLERTQDIGLMRALGAKRSNIFSIFAMESALIGFWGAMVGIAIGFGLGSIGNLIMRRVQPNVFTGDVSLLEFDPLQMLGIVAALSLIAFLAGTLPARKAAKTNVIDALRYE
jgi:putative ABC transport system permease protein